jgi:ribosome biogenesis protein
MSAPNATEADAAVDGAMQITVRFVTNLPPEFHVPKTPVVSLTIKAMSFIICFPCMHFKIYAFCDAPFNIISLLSLSLAQTVPANLTRYGLSQIINHLLGLDPPRPFDILIADNLLRTSLHKHVLDASLSTEAVLEVKYTPAVLPPTPKEEHVHDDWIAAIAEIALSDGSSVVAKSERKAAPSSPSGNPLLATGCYDGIVRLWQDNTCVNSFGAHAGAVKAVLAVKTSGQLLTTGDDGTARAWTWGGNATNAPSMVAALKGHTASIEAAACRNDGDRCVTGGWDGQALLWRAGRALATSAEQSGEEAASSAGRKKRKGSSDGRSVPTGGHEEAPLSALSGHKQCVAALAWPADDIVMSGSWDHSVKVWDVEVGVCVDTLMHNKAVHCIATPSDGKAAVVAFGGPEKVLRIWDRRQREAGEGLNGDGLSAFAVRSFSSHSGWISCLAWHPSSEHHVVSGSYDGTAKLWDLRAAVPLATLEIGNEQVLACAWVHGGTAIATGGVDCVLRTAEVEIPTVIANNER